MSHRLGRLDGCLPAGTFGSLISCGIYAHKSAQNIVGGAPSLQATSDVFSTPAVKASRRSKIIEKAGKEKYFRCGTDYRATMRLEYLPDGSVDCPLIRLYDFDVSAAMSLLRLVTGLADGSITTIALHEVREIRSVDECRLTLIAGKSDEGVIRLARANQFECVLTRTSWGYVAGLIEPFCTTGTSDRFQWLDQTSDISLLLSPAGLW